MNPSDCPFGEERVDADLGPANGNGIELVDVPQIESGPAARRGDKRDAASIR